MKRNIGTTDKYIRIAVGIVLVVLGYVTGLWWLYIIAAAAFITAFIGFCGLYALLGIKTTKK
jgi:hypothetical protein